MSAPAPASSSVVESLDGSCVDAAAAAPASSSPAGLDVSDDNPPTMTDVPFVPVYPSTTLVTKDGASVEVPSDRIAESKVLVAILSGDPTAKELPVSLKEAVLKKVIEFLDLYIAKGKPALVLPRKPIQDPSIVIWADWCNAWIRSLDAPTLQEVHLAANYLDIPHLQTVCEIRWATKLAGKSSQQIEDAITEGHDLKKER